jgi:hypothetical protein
MGERFDDATVHRSDLWEREVSVHPDCEGGPHWLVEWGDSDGGCYVTVFDGPTNTPGKVRARVLPTINGPWAHSPRLHPQLFA